MVQNFVQRIYVFDYHSKQKQHFIRMLFLSEMNVSELSPLPSNHLYSTFYSQLMTSQNTSLKKYEQSERTSSSHLYITNQCVFLPVFCVFILYGWKT